ncbi:MAG TPA: hypothetical protein VHA74_01415 [Candidatus Dojkabacteria bacterium]|nr:hypothetical protein [Candidatus Dojkabacteria bacterium]
MAPFTYDPQVINEVTFPYLEVLNTNPETVLPTVSQKLWDIKAAFNSDTHVNDSILEANGVSYWGIFSYKDLGDILVLGEVTNEKTQHGEYPSRLPSEVDALMQKNLSLFEDFICGEVVIPTIQRGDVDEQAVNDRELTMKYTVALLDSVLEQFTDERDRRGMYAYSMNMKNATKLALLR